MSILIKGKSRYWVYINVDYIKVEFGDYKWMPKSFTRMITYYTSTLLSVVSIVTSLATLILIIQLQK